MDVCTLAVFAAIFDPVTDEECQDRLAAPRSGGDFWFPEKGG